MNEKELEIKNSLTSPLLTGGVRSKAGTFMLQRQSSNNVDSKITKLSNTPQPSASEGKQKFLKQKSMQVTSEFSPNINGIGQTEQLNALDNQKQSIGLNTITENRERQKSLGQPRISQIQNVNVQRRSSICTPQVQRLTNQYYIVRKEFDPFKSPPDLQMAEKHKKARLVGEATQEQQLDQENYCPCCYSIIEKNPLPVNCDEKVLSFLGVGYSQVFMLNKFFGLLVVVIFVLGGSLLLLVKNQLQCENKCLKIMGIAIMANKEKDIELMNPYIQMLMAIFIIAAVLYVKKKIQKKINKFNEGYLSPCEYSIMVQNLPLDVRKDELKRHFEKILNREIVTVNMAYDTEKYNHAIEQKSNDIRTYNTTKYKIKLLLKELEQQNLTQSKQENIKNKIKKLEDQNQYLSSEMKITDEHIERFEKDCDNDRDPSKFLGTAFITFSDTVPVNTIISEYGYTYLNILKFIFFRWVTPPFIEYKGKMLIIRKAPAPADIIWENLRFSLPRNIANNTLMLFMSCILLFISFRIQFLVMQYVYPLKKESYEEHSFVLVIRGSLLSICVVIVNLSLRNTVFFFTKTQKFDHHTKLLNAYINKYIFLYFFNSAFMPYLVHGYLDKGNVNIELLVWDIHFIIIATSISTPLSKVFDPVMFYKMFKRWQIRSYSPEDCPYTQKEVNEWFEGHPIEIADSWFNIKQCYLKIDAYMARVLFLGAWYAQVAPLGILFSMFGLVANHYIDKYSLLRIHAIPELITEDVYSKVIFALDLLPFIYLCGGIEYNQKSIISTNVFTIVFKFMNESGAIIGLFLSMVAFIFHYKRKQKVKQAKKVNRTYEEVRSLFPTEYDRCNPVTASKASEEYIKFLYDQKALILSTNMQEMKAIDSKKEKKKVQKGDESRLMVDGTNVNHLIKSGSQQFKEKFMMNHSLSKSKLLNRQNQKQNQPSESSSDSSDSQNDNSDNEQNHNKQVKKVKQINLKKKHQDSDTSIDKSTRAIQGTVFLGQNPSTFESQVINNQLSCNFNSDSTSQEMQRISNNLPPPIQDSSIKKVYSEQLDNEEQLINKILQKQQELQEQKQMNINQTQTQNEQ